MLAREQKKSVIDRYQTHATDTGSPEVQIAIISERIGQLTDHFKTHQKDHGSRRGLRRSLGSSAFASNSGKLFPTNVSERTPPSSRSRPSIEDILQRASFKRIPPHQSRFDWKAQTRPSPYLPGAEC
ncbi:MAG: 30S ribosomal protein S15 [Candidatus Sulfotelmatobacter sp.]